MESKYKWNLKDIFEDEEKLEIARKSIGNCLKDIEKYKGKLKESASNIYECYRLYEDILINFEKVYAYSMLKYHQDMADSKNIKIFKDAEKMSADIMSKTAFITPEITKIDEEVIKRYIKENSNLARYEKSLKDIIEDKKHILSEEVEKILAEYSEVFNASENAYDIFTNTEFKYPNIIDENGKEVNLTDAEYYKYISSKNRRVRIEAFNSMYSIYKKHINTITELYMARVKEAVVTSKIRKYESSLDKAVCLDDSTIKVYNNLIETVNNNLSVNHRYMRLKKKLLQLDEMHMYDIYVNTLDNSEKNVSFEEAKDIVLEALKPMGEKYINKLKYAFENNWIDVYEEENKRGGAYSMGVYGVHPYVLTNFTNTSRDISTIAHELGHAMHSDYSNNNQTVMNANYTIMVAEVASTVNEIILGQYLINKEENKMKKAALINEQLDSIRATLIRQTMFAEFEKIIHEKVEKGETLTSDKLCEIYFNLNKKYFGEDVIIDENIKYEWSRIPHFYSCFYVYKYATGISAAIAIASNILNKEEGYVEKYIEMLKQGRIKKSVDLLRMVDVDLESKEPYEDAFKFYEKNLNELEKLVRD